MMKTKRLLMLLAAAAALFALSATSQAAVTDVYSVNFYAYGKGGDDYWDQEEWQETVTLEPDQAAGVGDWNTTGWENYRVPWDPGAPSVPVTITSNRGYQATFTLNDVRNGSPFYWAQKRTTLLGDGNGDMMDGHANGTEDPYDGTKIFDMTVSDIPYAVYDVIIYLGANEGQYGDGTGKIVFNGDPEQDFTLPPKGEFSSFDEIVNNGDTGNYIVYKGVTGSSFTLQVWGNSFNHLGPCGFQIAVDYTAPPHQASNPTPADGTSYIAADADLSWTAGLYSNSSNVYFGTDPTPDSGEFQGNQSGTTFDPGTMTEDTYYWRIDSVNDEGATTGEVWSFTVSNIFSVNFYGYGKGGATLWDQPDWRETVTLESGQSAGVGAWHTTGWVNYNGTSSKGITSTQGSTATIKVDNVRNYSPYYWTAKRTTLLGDGNADMMDGHGRGTESPGDGSLIFDFTVSNIPFQYYDVIIYLGCCSAWSGDDEAIIVFNGVEQKFTVMDELFDGTFTEFVDDVTPCNYIVYEGVSGSSFSVQVWGLGPEPDGLGFNHIGPRGLQIAEADIAPPEQATNPTPADGASHVLADADLSWIAGLFSTSSDVYFGTDPTPDSGEFQDNVTGATFDPGTLSVGTYYWRIDAVNSEGTTTGKVWSFTVGPPGKASIPSPFDLSSGISVDTDLLSWTAGEGAVSYNVYFGTDPTPDSGELQGNQPGTTFPLGTLAAGTTYYWRIDPVNGLGVTTGDVWSFTTMPTPAAGRNTFLVPMPYTGAGWQELAYLAAVPASAAINDSEPSVIALDGSGTIPAKVNEYLTLYNPANTYTIDTSGSLDDVVCYLAQTFWTTTARVVLCDDSDYPGALAASALAGRLEVPLMFFDGLTGLSSAALNVIENNLQCATALTISGNSTVTGQLSGIGVSQTSLADDKAIITWLVNNGYPVEYLAVCNANDRGLSDYAPKGSLAAALLATGRNGAVAALTYDTQWNLPFVRNSTTTTKPAGLPSNTEPPRKYHDPTDLNYDLGSCTVNGQTYDWVVVRMTNGDRLDAAFIDFNDDGDYGDAGEYCPRTCEVTINGKRYTVGVNSELPHPYAYGELRFTHPSDDELKEELQTYHNRIGHYPQYMALVGIPHVLPCAHALSYDRGWCDYVMNDHYFADVDDDPLYDIATGRIVGENVTYVTLNAARGLTYNDLQYRPASDHAYHQCPIEFTDRLYDVPRQLENRGFTVDEWLSLSEEDYRLYGVFIQDEHGWPFGIARNEFKENSPWTVCLVEGGGCNMASMDMYNSSKEWYDTNAVVLAREGAVCFNAWVRGTGAGKDLSRDSFFKAILYDGATMGEAHLYALNIMAAKSEGSIRSYDLNANMLYGDPAVRLHVPAAPTYQPAHITASGGTLTVHAPETYWVDYVDSRDEYVYTAPGLVGSYYDPAWTFFATYTTGLQITGMTQQGGVPSPLGWMTLRESKKYVIDEHWDGTRTIYWRVRFEQFNDSTGQLSQQINEIDYTVDFVTSDVPGDLDLNGLVNLVDYAGFAAHWLEKDCDLGNSFCGGADINMINDVGLDDLLILTGNWLEF